jgi:hypothetical protein
MPPDAFVFWMHQGYQFCFFRTSDGDDPPVYYYLQAGLSERVVSGQFVRKYEHYSEFLADWIDMAKYSWLKFARRLWKAGQTPETGYSFPIPEPRESNDNE